MIKQLGAYLGKYTKYAVWSPILVLIEVGGEILMPYLMSLIVDVGIPNKDIGYITNIGLLMIASAVVAILAGSANAFVSSKASTGFAANLRQGMFGKIQDFSFANIDALSTASLVTRMTSDVNTLQQTLVMGLRMLLRAPMSLIFALVMTLSVSVKLSTVLLFSIPVLAIAVWFLMSRAGKLFTAVQKRLDDVNSAVQEDLIGIRLVKAYVREKFQKAQFNVANDALFKTGLKASKLMIIAMPVMMLVMNFTIIYVLWTGGVMVTAEGFGTGELMRLLSYIMQILMSLMMVSMVLVMMARSRASGSRVQEVLNTVIDITDEKGGQHQIKEGRVVFDHVNFRYGQSGEGADVLRDVTFEARPGKVYAIVGGTGSAKSTLVSLIPRLYDVAQGSVAIDGVDVREYKLPALRSGIGMVLQKNVLFSGTIRENLLWGKEDATQQEVEAAAKAAQAHDFIMSFPDGYETNLSQGGVNVSGGQRQRLCIARAMLKKPPILILDDSTSAVDSDTESKIRQAFRDELRDTTVFLIAQRISSVMDADQIMVLDDGELVGWGSHQELLETNKTYQEIYYSQQEGGAA